MKFKTETDFENVLGKEIEIMGRISNIIWQHMIALRPEYPKISYFSLLDENGEEYHQLVVYSKETLPESTVITIKGRMIKTEGTTKHLDEKRRKYNLEYQFIADYIITR